MTELSVWLEIEGRQTLVGEIRGNAYPDAAFSYAEEYRAGAGAVPISLSLPLRAEPFSAEATKCFFEGLLPEGFSRRSVAAWLREKEEDYLAILAALGRECLGAIRILQKGETPPAASYEGLSLEQVKALAREGATKSTELLMKSHLSLTGASGKVGLYREENTGRWYLPKGDAPSTHILKQSHIRLNDLVINEQLCLLTARSLGIDTADSFVVDTGGARDEDILLATLRYDRKVDRDAGEISGKPRPLRLHQEDFAQAFGIPSAEKYERHGEGYLGRMFDLLRGYSANPVEDVRKLWDRIVFQYLIGNTDAHIKNFSLLRSPNLQEIRLAPAYDLLSTVIYESVARDMAFAIGGEYEIGRITREHFAAAADEARIGRAWALQRLDTLGGQMEVALRESCERLTEDGFPRAVDIRDRILREFDGRCGCSQTL